MVEHFGFEPRYYQALPEVLQPHAWGAQRDFELGETAIPTRYKELIGLAVAAHMKCRYCIYFHSQNARALGATDEEMREAVAMGGYTALFSNTLTGMQTDLDEFKEEVDRAVAFMTAGAHPGAHP
jgi:AhpD family alkylhydroperoxidase